MVFMITGHGQAVIGFTDAEIAALLRGDAIDLLAAIGPMAGAITVAGTIVVYAKNRAELLSKLTQAGVECSVEALQQAEALDRIQP